MRKFVLDNVVKYTDNEPKAKELLRLGYKEVADDGNAPGIVTQGQDPRPLEEVPTEKVEKGVHTLAEPTTDVVQAGEPEEAKEEPKKTASRKKAAEDK